MMKEIRRNLPSSESIVSETFNRLGYTPENINSQQAKERFEELLHHVWEETLHVLEEYEYSVYSKGIPSQLISREEDLFTEKAAHKNNIVQSVIDRFQRWYPYLREMFLSVAQSRKARGGRDFELQFGGMLDLMEVPYQKVKRRTRVDFMMPDDRTFEENPTSAVIASAKRTLRERWREVVEELYAMRSPNIFLVTADYAVSSRHVQAICSENRIHLVVWKEVKQKYSNPLVLSYDQWVRKRLPSLMQFW